MTARAEQGVHHRRRVTRRRAEIAGASALGVTGAAIGCTASDLAHEGGPSLLTGPARPNRRSRHTSSRVGNNLSATFDVPSSERRTKTWTAQTC